MKTKSKNLTKSLRRFLVRLDRLTHANLSTPFPFLSISRFKVGKILLSQKHPLIAARIVLPGVFIGIVGAASLIYVSGQGAHQVQALTNTANIFVSANGSDTGPNCIRFATPQANPDAGGTSLCGSFQKALQLASGGDTILVIDGTYGDQTLFYSDSPFGRTGSTSQVTFLAETMHGVTIGDLQLGANYGNASGRPASYVTFNGIDFNTFGNWSGNYLGCTTSGTDISGCQAGTFMTNVTIENANALSKTQNDIGISSGQNITLKNINAGPNCCNADAEIVIGATRYDNNSTGDHRTWFANGITLDNVYLHDSYGGPDNGTAACSSIPAAEWSNCSTEAAANTGNHPDCIQFVDAGTNITIKNSRFYNCPENNWGAVDLATGTQWFSNITLENNMFYGAKYYDMQFVGGVASSGGYPAFKGYLKLLYNSFSTVPEFAGFDASATVTATGNIFNGAAKCQTSNEVSDYTTTVPINSTYNMWTSGTCGTGDTDGTPTYVSTVYPWDLHLQSGSAGIDQSETSACAVASDIDGDSRPQGAACDIGADEYIPTANVWVSTTGNDSTCIRGDQTKPCLTLNKAYQLAQCADIIQVVAGTYDYQIIQYDTSKTDTEACRVTIQPAPGATPSFAALWVAADYITIKNMTVPDNGCTGSCNVSVEGVSGDTGSGNGHIWISPYPYSNGHTPDNDTIIGGSAPYFDLHCATNATVENGDYGPNFDYASHPSWGGASCQSYAKNIKILSNNIHDVILRQTGAHTNCMAAYNFDGLTISGNKIHGCENIAFRANWQSAWSHPPNGYNDNLTFENNMIWDGTITGGNTVQFVNPGGTYMVRGNSDLSTINSLGEAVSWDISTVPGIDPNLSFSFYDNIIPRFAANDCNLTGVILDYNIYTNPGGGNPDTGWPTCGPHDKTSTPDAEFISTTIPDLHLKASAIAIGAGNPTSCPATDIDGDTRPTGTACDAGADEYLASYIPPDTSSSGSSSSPNSGNSGSSSTSSGSSSPYLAKGDCNSDGHVNLTDLSILLSHYNTNYSPADFDANSLVNLTDLSILLSNYGK